ncbi:unnamed protein product [Lactuca saligna]|uniref:SURP motif domain-containing protein n=1 Tax=Lactuca saligna TaxID=75948 RepID=A0AA36EG64_LACSI|nr:unnamed protein product [Lactuca saligna]
MDIEIVGRHALLFDDDTTAAFVNSQDALVDWNSLLVDRYDVRHLLFSPPPSRRRRNPQTSHSTSADAEIDYERYLDLPSPSEEEEADPKPEPVGGFNAVPFSYGNNEESNDQKNAEAESEVPAFHPPFPVPESLVQNLPPTEKVHQIISRTALFVSKNGGQSEIVLRVKQGDNPTFGFLMPDHHLHPYFRFLVNHKDLLQSNEEKTSNTENPTGALSLLGSVYGTGEDDDNGTEHPSSSPSGKDDFASWQTKTTILPAGRDESVSKQSLDGAPIIRKNSFPNAVKAVKTSIMRKGESSTSSSVSGIRASSLPPIPKTAELMVMDPPSDMKKLVEKIVEFIIKNGRQFEGVLMEQDRGHGRFPFLIPSNIFHPYYLKVLHTAHESKSTVKSFHNEKGNASHKKMLNSRDTEASLMESDDIPLDSDRKEKFKMVMNKSKKEASDPPSKPTQEQSVQVDAAQAAAILQAATRGIKHPNLGILNGKFGGQQQQQSSSSNVNETDSNEQKLKAERLKRAKMFVAMLKSGTNPSKAEPTRGLSAEPQVSSDKKIKSEKEHLDDEKRSKRKYRDRSSIHNNDIDDDEGDEREEKRSHRHHKKKKHRSHESEEERHHSTSHKHADVDKKDHKRKKKHRSSSSSDDEDEHEYEHSRRKHRSHKSSSHKHRKSHSRSSRHKHKHTHDDGKASNSEEGEMSSKRGHVVDNVSREASVDVSSSSYQEQKPQPSQITEVPDELRAKIRAMLMSTICLGALNPSTNCFCIEVEFSLWQTKCLTKVLKEEVAAFDVLKEEAAH